MAEGAGRELLMVTASTPGRESGAITTSDPAKDRRRPPAFWSFRRIRRHRPGRTRARFDMDPLFSPPLPAR